MGQLSRVLKEIAPATQSADILVGPEGLDDVGAVRMSNGRIGLFTTDFFPPVLDDPYAYGEIAVANSLSDIWASGGEPTVVLNIAAFPPDWGEEDTLQPLFRGAVAKVREAGALWVGGHTKKAAEPMFGFAVYGECNEDELVLNSGAKPGDLLYLTKSLGAGSITTGVVRGVGETAHIEAAMAGMAQLNNLAGRAMRTAKVKAGTDITGFGVLGHAGNIARASGVRMELRAVALPLYAGAADLAAKGVISGASAKSRVTLADLVELAPGIPDWLVDICFDAETSGGILACVAEDQAAAYEAAFPVDQRPALVGQVTEGDAAVVLS